jgi:hypothetical protein
VLLCGADQLLRDLKLVDRLVEGASRTDVGYAGALATVATTIIKSSAGDPQVSPYLDGTRPPSLQSLRPVPVRR